MSIGVRFHKRLLRSALLALHGLVLMVAGAALAPRPLVLLTLDYLFSQEAIAPGWVELAGVSFGAYLAAVPAVLDTRIKRLWLIHGSADPEAVLEYGLLNCVMVVRQITELMFSRIAQDSAPIRSG